MNDGVLGYGPRAQKAVMELKLDSAPLRNDPSNTTMTDTENASVKAG